MAEPARLDGPAVARRLARIDELLERVEQVPGPTSEAAIEAVRALTEVYGEALARVRDLDDARLDAHLAEDELLGHLLVLHDLHPEPVGARVARALDVLRPAVRKRGGEVEPAGVDGSVAHVRIAVRGCGGAADVEEAVREAVLAAAPELSEVRCTPAGQPDEQREAAFVPLETLLRRPAAAGEPS